MKIVIRPENEADHLPVEVLTREAFWNLYRPGCDEHYTTHLIRGHEDFLPDLTFVAEVDGQIVGSIIYARSWVINELGEKVETATFGPLCVHPAWQRRGVGSALIGHSRALAAQKGYPAIVILGDPHNYCKHGFKTGKDVGVSTLDGRYPLGLLVLELRPGLFLLPTNSGNSNPARCMSSMPARWRRMTRASRPRKRSTSTRRICLPCWCARWWSEGAVKRDVTFSAVFSAAA